MASNGASAAAPAAAGAGAVAGAGAMAPVQQEKFLTIEARKNSRRKPFAKRTIILTLPSSATVADIIEETLQKRHDITSLSTGRGAVMDKDFLHKPVGVLADALEEGEKWHLKVSVLDSSGMFSQLDDNTVQDIFRYAGDCFSLQNCELTCSRFKSLLSNDDIWQHFNRELESGNDCDYEPMSAGKSNREESSRFAVLRGIKIKQNSTENILLPNIKNILARAIDGLKYGWRGQRYELEVRGDALRYEFEVRGDALGLAADLVQAHIIAKLENAMRIAIRASKGRGKFPVLTCDELDLVTMIRPPSYAVSDHHGDSTTEIWLKGEDFDLTKEHAFYAGTVRRLANRAGVVEMTYTAMKKIIADVHNTLMRLLYKPAEVHKTQLVHERFKYETDEDIDLWRDIPPAVALEDGGYQCVIVPGQIEDWAKSLGIGGPFTSYYGQTWLLSDGQTLEEAITAAKQRYMIEPAPLSDGYESLSSMDFDPEDHEVESSEEELSVDDVDDRSDDDDDSLWGVVRSDGD